MKKQIRTLVQLGVVYLVVSIVLDYFLSGYPVLTWAGVGFAFVFFGIMIFNVLLELKARPAQSKGVRRFERGEDDLARLDKLCQRAIDQGDAASGELLSERIRSLAFAAASYHFNIAEPFLRSMARENPASLALQINDHLIFEALTSKSSGVGRGSARDLASCLTSIEAWLG